MLRALPLGFLLSLAATCMAQQTPLAERVLVLVNDRMPKEGGTGSMGASIFVGQYYAGKRNIPAANILHLKTSPAEAVSIEELSRRSKALCVSFWIPMAAPCGEKYCIS